MHRGQLAVALLSLASFAAQPGCSDPDCPENTRKIGITCVPLRLAADGGTDAGGAGDGGTDGGLVGEGGTGTRVAVSAAHSEAADGGTVKPDSVSDSGDATQVVGGQDAAIASTCDGPPNECGGCSPIEPSHVKGQPCSNGGQGACDLPGTYGCLGGTTVCSAPSATPSHEVCDGTDNDCDGMVDEGLTNTCGGCVALTHAQDSGCDNGLNGACLAVGVYVCTGTKDAVACTAPLRVGSSEVCNGVDDDCDGHVDDGLTACVNGRTDACTPDPCQNGGSCSNPGAACTCPPGYAGSRCETNVNDCSANPCSPGSCRDGVNTYTCDCGAGLFTVGQSCVRFRNNGDFTISDAKTGLTWQENVDVNTFTFVEATNHCTGQSGAAWRLPTLDELKGLVDSRFDPAIDATYFKGAQAPSSSLASIFWSTTSASATVDPVKGVFYGFAYWASTGSGAINATIQVSARCVH